MEPAAWGEHADCGRSEGVIGRKCECTPVLATLVRSVWRAGEDVMPFENVGFGRVSSDVLRRSLAEGSILSR